MEKKITFIRSGNLASVDYAYASSIPAGMDVLFLAGACPLDKGGNVPHPSTYEQQAKLCVENLKEVLKESDAALEDVVYTRVLVASGDRSDLVASWRAVREEFGEHDVPSTLSGVTVLGYEHQLVEIEAVAAVDGEGGVKRR
ncbi:RidA family protein [Lysinibacillus sphaericus]